MTNIILIIHCERGGCADELARVAQKVREDVKDKLGYTVTIGVGNLKHSALQIHTSYVEAQQAVEISRKLGKQDSTVLYNNLGAYNILSTISQTDEAKNFYTNYLGQLFRFDEENNGDLKSTLECLVKHDWNMKAAADELFIHYNTMKYRYKKICELLQMDLQEPEQKLNITLSLKLYQLAQ